MRIQFLLLIVCAAPDETLEKYAKDADILIHEVYSVEGFQSR